MRLEEFRTLYAYNDWANDRLLMMLSDAFGEETDLFRAENAMQRVIQERTAHIVWAQAIWRNRWEGVSPTTALVPEAYSTPQSLRKEFDAERTRFWKFFATLDEAALPRPFSYTTLSGVPYTEPLEQAMQHVITHGVYHRGQVTALLMALGQEEAVTYTDLILFYREREASTAPQ